MSKNEHFISLRRFAIIKKGVLVTLIKKFCNDIDIVIIGAKFGCAVRH